MVFGIQPKRNYRSYKKKHVENEKNESAKVVYVYRWQVTLPDSLLSIKRGYFLSTPFESNRKCASEKNHICNTPQQLSPFTLRFQTRLQIQRFLYVCLDHSHPYQSFFSKCDTFITTLLFCSLSFVSVCVCVWLILFF